MSWLKSAANEVNNRVPRCERLVSQTSSKGQHRKEPVNGWFKQIRIFWFLIINWRISHIRLPFDKTKIKTKQGPNHLDFWLQISNSRFTNGTFPWRKCSVKALVSKKPANWKHYLYVFHEINDWFLKAELHKLPIWIQDLKPNSRKINIDKQNCNADSDVASINVIWYVNRAWSFVVFCSFKIITYYKSW